MCVYCVAWSLRVALLLRCGIQKLPNFSKTINSNLFPNHKLIYVSPSLILYLVILFFFFLRNVFSNTCYTNCSNYNFNCFFFFNLVILVTLVFMYNWLPLQSRKVIVCDTIIGCSEPPLAINNLIEGIRLKLQDFRRTRVSHVL